jgi:hypothetical protein
VRLFIKITLRYVHLLERIFLNEGFLAEFTYVLHIVQIKLDKEPLKNAGIDIKKNSKTFDKKGNN